MQISDDPDWLIFSREHLEIDGGMVASDRKTGHIPSGIESEYLAKVSSYKLAVPKDVNPDSSLAAKCLNERKRSYSAYHYCL